jgi:SPOR domain
VASVAGTCPRCDAPRDPGQRYCLDCGLRLPAAEGAVATLRRAWVRGFGWYPGDWVWPAALALVVAALGAAGAVALAKRGDGGGTTFAATNAAASAAVTAAPSAPASGLVDWPAARNGWTVVLVSLPRAVGPDKARERAAKAKKTGLPDPGYLVSDRYPSLHPGYYVVFAGIYTTRAEAEAAVPTARAKGFGGAYARPVAS